MHTTIGIFGAGNSARALAAYLAQQGHQVCLYARKQEQLKDIIATKTIRAKGRITGCFPIYKVCDDLADFMNSCQLIYIATVATAYEDVARQLACHITAQHALVLFSGKLGGCLVIEKVLNEQGCPVIPVIETDSLFACRTQEDGTIWIRGFKQWTLFSASTASLTWEYRHLIQDYFPQLEPAKNIIQRGCTDFGAHAHTVITLANISRIDNQEPFLFYYEGLSENTIVLLEKVEQEFKSIAAAYDTPLVDMKELLNNYYGCNTESLYSAMTSVPNYKHSLGPTSFDHRYLHEDVTCTIMPMLELAQKANISAPIMQATASLSKLLSSCQDIYQQARSLATFGWQSLTTQEITACVMQ